MESKILFQENKTWTCVIQEKSYIFEKVNADIDQKGQRKIYFC
jgi:hypothetical protein